MENDIDYENAKILLKNNTDAILLDVRSPQEYKEFHLEGAINIPLYNIERKIEKFFPNKGKIIILYCQTGSRSEKAFYMLSKMGYFNLYNLAGGINGI